MYLLCKADSDKAENSEDSEYLHDDCVREYIFSEKKKIHDENNFRFSDYQCLYGRETQQ